MAEIGKVTAKQSRAIAALLSAKSVAEAAKAATVGERTLRRWLTEGNFRAALTAAQSEALGVVTARLVALLGSSLDVLAADLEGTDAGRRSRAALGILGRFADLAQFLSLEARVTALEQHAVDMEQTLEAGGVT